MVYEILMCKYRPYLPGLTLILFLQTSSTNDDILCLYDDQFIKMLFRSIFLCLH